MYAKQSNDSCQVQLLVLLSSLILARLGLPAAADVRLPSIFGDRMILQQNQPNLVWGWAEPGEEVTVAIAGQSHSATAAAEGTWRVLLDSLPAGGPYQLHVSGQNVIMNARLTSPFMSKNALSTRDRSSACTRLFS